MMASASAQTQEALTQEQIAAAIAALPDSALHKAVSEAIHTRKIHGGLGLRDVFYWKLKALYARIPDKVVALLHSIPSIGYWGDLWRLYELVEGLRLPIVELVRSQFNKDRLCSNPDECSLLAKWLPRESSKRHPGLARVFADACFPHVDGIKTRMCLYRKITADMNRKINTAEVLMCGRAWPDIRVNDVPRKGRQKYARAFARHGLDPDLKGWMEAILGGCWKSILHGIHTAPANENPL